MRELSIHELNAVSGAGVIAESTGFGGGAGAALGILLTDTAEGAARGGAVGAGIGFAWGLGYAGGTYLYKHFFSF